MNHDFAWLRDLHVLQYISHFPHNYREKNCDTRLTVNTMTATNISSGGADCWAATPTATVARHRAGDQTGLQVAASSDPATIFRHTTDIWGMYCCRPCTERYVAWKSWKTWYLHGANRTISYRCLECRSQYVTDTGLQCQNMNSTPATFSWSAMWVWKVPDTELHTWVVMHQSAL